MHLNNLCIILFCLFVGHSAECMAVDNTYKQTVASTNVTQLGFVDSDCKFHLNSISIGTHENGDHAESLVIYVVLSGWITVQYVHILFLICRCCLIIVTILVISVSSLPSEPAM